MKSITTNTVMNLFNQLSPSEQMKVADRIGQQTFSERWNLLDKELPDAELSEEEIMEEVRAVRYGK